MHKRRNAFRVLLALLADARYDRVAYVQWFLNRVADDPAFHTKVL